MKKRTVITTEKREVWVIRDPSEVPAGIAQAPETDSWESEPGNESLRVLPERALPEEYPDKNVPPTGED